MVLPTITSKFNFYPIYPTLASKLKLQFDTLSRFLLPFFVPIQAIIEALRPRTQPGKKLYRATDWLF